MAWDYDGDDDLEDIDDFEEEYEENNKEEKAWQQSLRTKVLRVRGAGCGASRERTVVEMPPNIAVGAPCEIIRVLSGLDNRLAKVLLDGDIKLLRVDWLQRQSKGWRLWRRQELEREAKAD